jgi:DHA1 family inner membrane transport protein
MSGAQGDQRHSDNPSIRFDDRSTVDGVRAAILTMALGAFAIGLTEFAIMGLLPGRGRSDRLGTHRGQPRHGVRRRRVVGAPLLIAAGARRSRRTLLLAFMGLFAVGNGPKPVL